MNYELFIARKIVSGKTGNKRFTSPVIRVAIGAIALGVAVMVVSVMVVTGFRNEITNKVIGFGAHIRINNFDSNNSYEENPINNDAPFVKSFHNDPQIKHIQQYATKAGIIKTSEEIKGIVLKGVGKDYDWSYFRNKMTSGRILQLNDTANSGEVMISLKTSKELNLKTGDEMVVYFIEQPPRIRKFIVSGIYETGLDEFDDLYVFCDIGVIRKLNNWNKNQVGGFELTVNDFSKLDEISDHVYSKTGYQYNTRNIIEQYPQIFHWLDLQNINVIIIITLILLVAGISMISTLLILILENTSMIGILKALGAKDYSIRKIFIYIALPVIGTGVLLGNLLGITLCLLQLKFGIVTLSQESYYVSQVPVNFSISYLLLLNVGTMIACFLMLIGPSMVISRILPAAVIRLD